jgi:hypothetical protein
VYGYAVTLHDRDSRKLYHHPLSGDPTEESVVYDGDSAETDDGAAETDDGAAETDDGDPGDGESKQGKLLANKIRNGIKDRVKQIKARKRQAVSTEVILSNPNQSENPQATLFELMMAQPTKPMPMEDFITRIWAETNRLLRDSEDISWKFLFICSCLRILHPTKNKNRNVTRWLNIVRITNSIVDGLWKHWGPHALFVYEALAGKVISPRPKAAANAQVAKNYLFGSLTRSSKLKRKNIVIAVISNLSGDLLPHKLQGANVFHPPAVISIMLNMTKYHYLPFAELVRRC